MSEEEMVQKSQFLETSAVLAGKYDEIAALTAERDRYKAALEKIAAGIMFPAAVAHAALKDIR